MFSGLIGQKPVWFAKPGVARDLAGHLRRDHVDELRFIFGEIGFHDLGLGIDALHAAVHFRILPLDHAGIMLLPAFHEQGLLGEAFLRIEDHDFRFLVALGFQHMRHHRDALVGSGRAAIRIGRCHHDDQRAVLERIELFLQELGLRTRLPGMRHDLGRGFGIAGHRIELDVDARRDHQPVIGQRRAVREAHGLLVPVDRGARSYARA